MKRVGSFIEEMTVPCMFCGTPTHMLGTHKCDRCWELERLLRNISSNTLDLILKSIKE